MNRSAQDKVQLVDVRSGVDGLVYVSAYPLSQQILRTDVSGMPLEGVDYREAAGYYGDRAKAAFSELEGVADRARDAFKQAFRRGGGGTT